MSVVNWNYIKKGCKKLNLFISMLYSPFMLQFCIFCWYCSLRCTALDLIVVLIASNGPHYCWQGIFSKTDFVTIAQIKTNFINRRIQVPTCLKKISHKKSQRSIPTQLVCIHLGKRGDSRLCGMQCFD